MAKTYGTWEPICTEMATRIRALMGHMQVIIKLNRVICCTLFDECFVSVLCLQDDIGNSGDYCSGPIIREWVSELAKTENKISELTRTSRSEESDVIEANKAVSSAGTPGSLQHNLLK
jgi:hypothetical protein